MKNTRYKIKNVIVFVTVPSAKEGRKIANALIKARLAACVNTVPRISSVYWWKGKVERSAELLLIIKTRKDLFKKIVDIVKRNHSYAVPEIISVVIDDGNPDYLAWISSSIKNAR